jgi:hypothetical protein
MKTFLKTFLLFAFALALMSGCKDDSEDMRAPAELILGQWQEIARGNSMNPELTPNGLTIEFLPDGTYYGPYGFHRGASMTAHYRLEGDSLYLYDPDVEMSPYAYIYRYTFPGKKQLRADHIYGDITFSGGTPTFHIYERIK